MMWGRNGKGLPEVPWWFWWWLAVTIADLSIYFLMGLFWVLYLAGVRP